MPYLKTPIRYPPNMPIKSVNMVSTGSMIRAAQSLGTAKYLIGFTAKVCKASICSVTFIVPISAAVEEPIRPATMMAVRTGPNSMHIETLTKLPM